jgi:hypothetical protein
VHVVCFFDAPPTFDPRCWENAWRHLEPRGCLHAGIDVDLVRRENSTGAYAKVLSIPALFL